MASQLLICVLVLALAHKAATTCTPENIPQVDPFLCCNLDSLLEKTIFTQCKSKFGDTMMGETNVKGSVPSGCCFSECVLNATAVLKNGVIDNAFAINYLVQRIPDARMKQVITSGVTECLSEATKRKDEFDAIANLPPPPNGQRICNPLSGHFIGCVHSNLFRNCPDTRWIPKQECQMLKDYFIKCPLPFPMHA